MPTPTSSALTGSAPAAKKKRPPPQLTFVHSVERVTPGVLRVSLEGAGLASFAASKPAAHMKLFFPAGDWPPPEGIEAAPRPPSRTYTPRRYDASRGILEIEFVKHGAGLAADWAARAKPGDKLWVAAGPGGGYAAPEGMTKLVLLADETAMPAAGMVIESLGASVAARVYCEIANGAEARALSPHVACEPVWLNREPTQARPGSMLEAAMAAPGADLADAHFWIACEAGAMRRIRDHLTRWMGIDRARVHTRGYWRYGDVNYPDHDYGAD